MNPLERLSAEELVKLSDENFQDVIRQEARALSAQAMDTYEEVMASSDDDQARLMAADRVLKLSDAHDEKLALPSGLTEEVFKIALAGLGSLAKIARASTNELVLKDVSPAKTDPRPVLTDNSPMNLTPTRNEINDADEDKIENYEETLDVEE